MTTFEQLQPEALQQLAKRNEKIKEHCQASAHEEYKSQE